jgi:hypothetical protein
VLGMDSVSDFNALHSRKHDDEVQLYAFDILALGGEDLRQLPLERRKTHLTRLMRGRPDGIFIAPFESGAIGPDLFRGRLRPRSLRPGVEATRSPLQRGPVGRLDQGEEPDSSGDIAGDGLVQMNGAISSPWSAPPGQVRAEEAVTGRPYPWLRAPGKGRITPSAARITACAIGVGSNPRSASML